MEDLTEELVEDIFITDIENLVDEILANVERLNNVNIGQIVLVAKSFENQKNHSVGQITSILDDGDDVLISFMVMSNKTFHCPYPEQEFVEDRCNIHKILNIPEQGHMKHFVFSIDDMEVINKCCRK